MDALSARKLVAAVALALAGAACGADAAPVPGDAIPFEEPATTFEDQPSDAENITTNVAVDVVESGDLIAFQATWLCELQRRTFPDLESSEAALNETLTAAGLERSDYDAFVESLAESQELRDEVLDIFARRCLS